MLAPNEITTVQAELVEYIAGAIRSIAIEHRLNKDDVLAALLGAQGMPCSKIIARIAMRMSEHTPSHDLPAFHTPRPVKRGRRWKIPPFRGQNT